jgi:hypothetical protein
MLVGPAVLLVPGALDRQAVTERGSPNPTATHLGAAAAVGNTGILVFREGLESILVLSAITASLARTQSRWGRPVAAGAGVAFLTRLDERLVLGIQQPAEPDRATPHGGPRHRVLSDGRVRPCVASAASGGHPGCSRRRGRLRSRGAWHTHQAAITGRSCPSTRCRQRWSARVSSRSWDSPRPRSRRHPRDRSRARAWQSSSNTPGPARAIGRRSSRCANSSWRGSSPLSTSRML